MLKLEQVREESINYRRYAKHYHIMLHTTFTQNLKTTKSH